MHLGELIDNLNRTPEEIVEDFPHVIATLIISLILTILYILKLRFTGMISIIILTLVFSFIGLHFPIKDR